MKCKKISAKFDKKHTLENLFGKFFQITTLVLVHSPLGEKKSGVLNWMFFEIQKLIFLELNSG
jgi:hypothetical protein